MTGVADEDSNDESVAVRYRATSQDPKYNGLDMSWEIVVVSDTTPQQVLPQSAPQQEASGDYSELIARMKEWRNDPEWVSEKAHTDRWDRRSWPSARRWRTRR